MRENKDPNDSREKKEDPYLFEIDVKTTCTFKEFLDYLEKMTAFDSSQKQYRDAMAIMDQSNEGKEAEIEDIVRVLKTYSNLTHKEIDGFLEVHTNKNKGHLAHSIYNRLALSDSEQKLELDNIFEKETCSVWMVV